MSVPEAVKAMTADLVWMVAGVLAVASALGSSGAGDLIGNALLNAFGSNPSSIVVMLAFCYPVLEEWECFDDAMFDVPMKSPEYSLLTLWCGFCRCGGIDRDALRPEHFASWMDWAEANGMKLDFNSTSFSHPKSGMLTLSNPDEGIRRFWVEHTKRCREIAEEMGRRQGDPAMLNIWIHDGSKDTTVNRIGYRRLLKQSLDEIFAVDYANMKDCIEAKLFGIGAESYTVGSYDFYLGYGAKYGKIVTLDTGHFHLTESIADKVSSLLLFTPEIMLHVSRPIRWDSDHVVIMNDDTLDLAKEIVRCDALDRVHIGLDYFDASINRIGAYVVGARATQKCVLQALLEPLAKLREYEASDRLFERLALLEEAKNLPWNAVWDMFCLQNDVPAGEAYIADVEKYEKDVTSKRA